MKRRLALPAIVLAGVMIVSARSAAADPLQITGGQIIMGSLSGTMDLRADRGFTLTGGLGVMDAFFGPSVQCGFGFCDPGETIDLSGQWVGTSIRGGVLTIDGQTYPQVGGLSSPNQARIQLFGSVVAPEITADTVTLLAPFLMEGNIAYATSLFVPATQETLAGRGTASLTLRRVFGGETGLPVSWAYSSARYDFETADAVPEPATMALTAAGLVGVALRKRRQTRSQPVRPLA